MVQVFSTDRLKDARLGFDLGLLVAACAALLLLTMTTVMMALLMTIVVSLRAFVNKRRCCGAAAVHNTCVLVRARRSMCVGWDLREVRMCKCYTYYSNLFSLVG